MSELDYTDGKLNQYPALEFQCERILSDDKGSRKKVVTPFYMDLTTSGATKDHVLHYAKKGYQIIGFHNVSNELIEKNETIREVVSTVNAILGQVQRAVHKKPIAELVEKQKEKAAKDG